MAKREGFLRFGLFVYPVGHHIAAWRHPDAVANAGINFDYYRNVASLAEAAKFDLLFLADGAGTRGDNLEILSRTAHSYVAQFEPLTLLSALSAVTSHIGLVATASSSFNEPFHIARKFASLDHLSGGRAGYNLVTSASDFEARNFNLDRHYEHADRYERAEEFADVVTGLWNSWEDDAFLYDKEQARFFDPNKRHVLDHKGKHFSVQGPLNVPRSPQGHPVTVQAGSSAAGRELAAKSADVVFTAQQTVEEASAFYKDVKQRAAHYGRDADDIKIMPGIFPVVGRTRQEAQDKFDQLQNLIHPSVGLNILSSGWSGPDLSQFNLDGPVPELPETQGSKSRQELLFELARRENLTIRELYLRVAGARGHLQIVGTATDVADALEERFETYGADGFNVMPPIFPAGLEDFAELVLPELRRRGLARSDYDGPTLRDNLGLKIPIHPATSVQSSDSLAAIKKAV
ncbi:LLM class flavin-dependent oxidoreductase [Brucella sp.]|uniref:LLM class flavin-dependent oxidoreductase n=1 Tax=Brucella sp. TaxID=52132 RepID=UPI0028A61B67|nr:LLM class flavin-dependent oxidoreductase [Brucella sp.]